MVGQSLDARRTSRSPTSQTYVHSGVAPVGAGHMVGVRAVLAAHVTALMDADALAPMKISTVRAVIRTSTSARMSGCGAEYRKSWTSM